LLPQRFKLLAAVPFMLTVACLAPATASADPSANASCVAQAVHGELGPLGQTHRELHAPMFGQAVSSVAHIPPQDCLFGPADAAGADQPSAAPDAQADAITP
jgi:hypothetical protein